MNANDNERDLRAHGATIDRQNEGVARNAGDNNLSRPAVTVVKAGAEGQPRTLKPKVRWKNASNLHRAIELVVLRFFYRAESASSQARYYRQMYLREGPGHWSHSEWLRYRAERSNWLWTIRLLLSQTQENGLLENCSEDRNRALRYEQEEAA